MRKSHPIFYSASLNSETVEQRNQPFMPWCCFPAFSASDGAIFDDNPDDRSLLATYIRPNSWDLSFDIQLWYGTWGAFSSGALPWKGPPFPNLFIASLPILLPFHFAFLLVDLHLPRCLLFFVSFWIRVSETTQYRNIYCKDCIYVILVSLNQKCLIYWPISFASNVIYSACIDHC